MSKVLVVGASGGMGYAIVRELLKRDCFDIVAFSRKRSKLEELFGNESNVAVVAGDALHSSDLHQAASGCDIVFHAMNVPYPEWDEKLPVLLRNIVSVVKSANAKLVVVDNIYAYGRSSGYKITEDFPKHPHTRKGKIRVQLEDIVKTSGVPFLIAHFPDFYGPHAENTLLHQTFKAVAQNRRAVFVGDLGISREYIYTPDGANALVELSCRDGSYGQEWNIPGAGVISGYDILRVLRRQGYSKGFIPLKKWVFQAMGMFSKNMKEVVEMFYLNESPVVLSGEKLEAELGMIPQTPYEIGIARTIKFLQNV